jgi:arsenite methyltransferase
MRVLDLGCGEGRDLLAWNVVPSDDVMGVDIDGARVGAARERFPGRTYWQAASESLPFADASFDRVISNAGVPYMDIAKAFAEAHRVLLPGGRLSMSIHRWNFTMSELRNYFQNLFPRCFGCM